MWAAFCSIVPPARLHLAWPRLETPDATAGIWVITKGDPGGISENDSLFTSSLRLQSSYKRCRAFQRRRCAAFSGRRVANVEKRIERGKRRSRRECRVLKNPSLMMPQERSGREQTKVSKTSKGALFQHGSLFLLFPLLSKHVFTNCQAVSWPLQALHSPQVYSAGGGGADSGTA